MRLPLYLILFLLSGCAAIPWQMSVFSTVVDVGLKHKTGKKLQEHGLSAVTNSDCNFGRLMDGVFPCMTEEEYVDYLLEMDCEVYSWNNVLQIPKCEKTLDKL